MTFFMLRKIVCPDIRLGRDIDCGILGFNIRSDVEGFHMLYWLEQRFLTVLCQIEPQRLQYYGEYA